MPGRSTIRHMASSAAAYATDSDVASSAAASLSDAQIRPPSPSHRRRSSKERGLMPLSSQEASEYLNNLLALPSSRPFPPALALRILTHKSYIGSHVLGAGFQARSQPNTAPAEGGAAHNARILSVLGQAGVQGLLFDVPPSRGHASTTRTRSYGFGDIDGVTTSRIR